MTRATRVGSWRIWIPAAHREAQPRGGEMEMQMQWLTRAERLATTGTPCHRSKHAATYRTCVDGRDVYLKRYHRYRWWTALKDMLRASKARHGTVLRGAWVATSALDGMPLAEKRRLLAALGTAVARLHERGFVAGDLVPASVWVAGSGETETLAFRDHDRTRAGHAAAAWMGARRNLVQLNRIVLAGVVATDRARVCRAYVAGRGWSRALARRRLPWVIAKTIERRPRFDGVDDAAAVGFRALMRATQRSGR
jgi:hypothetical protein